MKKALVLALTAFMVLAMATAAFAVEVSYEGKVAVKWGNEISNNPTLVPGVDEEGNPVFEEEVTDKDTGFAQDALEAKVKIEFKEDYGNGVSAGVVTIVEAHADVYNDDGDVNKEYKFDGGGWIQLERDLFTAKASTDINGNAAKDLGGENDIAGAPGLGVDLKLVDGLTINTVLNAGPYYGYVVKGEYAQDLFSVGAGFQGEKEGAKVKIDEKTSYDLYLSKTAFAVFGSINPIEPVTIKAEYAKREIAPSDDLKKMGDMAGLELDDEKFEATAILASAAYAQDAIDAKASFLMQDFGFNTLNDDDADQDWRISDAYRFEPNHEVSILFADASYKVTDDLEINGYFDYLLSVKDAEGEDLPEEEEKEIEKLSYKVGAAYTMDALTLEGWYKAYANSQVGAKATYALAEGVNASFEVGYNMFDDEDTDNKVTYTAMVEAGF